MAAVPAQVGTAVDPLVAGAGVALELGEVLDGVDPPFPHQDLGGPPLAGEVVVHGPGETPEPLIHPQVPFKGLHKTPRTESPQEPLPPSQAFRGVLHTYPSQ